jgi:hypothetical protein
MCGTSTRLRHSLRELFKLIRVCAWLACSMCSLYVESGERQIRLTGGFDAMGGGVEILDC